METGSRPTGAPAASSTLAAGKKGGYTFKDPKAQSHLQPRQKLETFKTACHKHFAQVLTSTTQDKALAIINPKFAPGTSGVKKSTMQLFTWALIPA